MQLSETIKLYLTKEQRSVLSVTMDTYIHTVNGLVSDAVNGISIAKYTSKDVDAPLPSVLRCQCVRDAKSILAKHYKSCHAAVLKNRNLAKRGTAIRVKAPNLPVLKKPCCYINNQNFKINGDCIEFPVMVNGTTRRISVRTRMTDRQLQLLSGTRLGTMRIVTKGRDIIAQIVYDIPEAAYTGMGNVMGVDLGIKCPAVSYCSDGSVKFYGNGRKNNHSLHTWSFYRLAQFIEYKAKLAGITVEYVNPAFTSQRCPVCGHVHHAHDRSYRCPCGYHTHRDLLGARNICDSTEYVGGNNTRHTA